MRNRMADVIDGLKNPMGMFLSQMDLCSTQLHGERESAKLLQNVLRDSGFDSVTVDDENNTIGVIKGLRREDSIVLLSKLNVVTGGSAEANFAYPVTATPSTLASYAAGIATNALVGAAVKRSILPLKGDLIHCFIPQSDGYGYGLKHLMENVQKEYGTRIKGVILVEPTEANIFLGNKGHLEYEIHVKGKLEKASTDRRGLDMFGTMFPLVHELEKVSHSLPTNASLGNSRLRIKDVHYTGNSIYDDNKEFHLVVDRKFVPEENADEILSHALQIAKNIYKTEHGNDFEVSTMMATKKVRTRTGAEYVAKKTLKPWMMEAHHPFVLQALSALRDARVDVGVGYWKEMSTYGGYTHTELGLPTIGMGPGSEEAVMKNHAITIDAVEKSAVRICDVVRRIIGMPTFGWSEDEI